MRRLAEGDERRQHPRLKIRLPVSYRLTGLGGGAFHQNYTTNIAPGGLQFIVAGQAPQTGERLEVELTVPPGEGHFPYAGRIHGDGKILRCQPCPGGRERWAVAACFDKPLALEFR